MMATSATSRSGQAAASTGRLALGQRLAFLGCSAAIGIFSAFNNFTLTLWLATFTSSYVLLGLLGNSRTFEGALVSPVAGAWSDRTWLGWLGRRRPFILAGGLLSALLLALTPVLARFPLPLAPAWLPGDPGALAPIVLTILLFTVTFNAMDDIHRALLTDVTTTDERSLLSAQAIGVEMVAQVSLLVVGALFWTDRVPDEAFVVVGALVAGGVLVTVLGVREPDPAAWVAERSGHGDVGPHSPTRRAGGEGRLPITGFLRRYRGVLALNAVMFCYWSGVNAVLPLVSIYVRDILGGTVGEAQLLPALMLLSTMLVTLPIGWLGTRYGKRPIMGAGAALIGCAALGALVITNLAEGAIVFVMAGIGNAAVLVLMVPLLADLVPHRHMGVATGILAASGSIAAPVASLAAGALSDVYGPRAIFGLMAAMVALALVVLPFARPHAGDTAPRPT